MKSLKKKQFLLPIGILVLAGLILWYLLATNNEPKVKASKIKRWPVATLTIYAESYTPKVYLYGKFESPYTSTLESTIQAYVAKTPAKEGALVKQGQLLVELDNKDVELIYKQRKAEVEELKASIKTEYMRYKSDQKSLEHEQELLKLSKRDLSRQEHLVKTLAGSLQQADLAREDVRRRSLEITKREFEIDNYKNRLNGLVAKLDRAKSLLEQAELDLHRTKITSPYNGRVTKLFVAKGERVQPGESLIEIFDSSAVEIRAQIPAIYIKTIRDMLQENQELVAIGNLDGEKIPLKLVRHAAQVGTGRAGVDGLFKVDMEHQQLALGRTIAITMDLPEIKNVYAIPIQSLYGSNTVYKVENDALVGVDVERVGVSRLTDTEQAKLLKQSGLEELELDNPYNEWVLIRSKDLKNGDRILITQLPNAVTGLKVKIIGK